MVANLTEPLGYFGAGWLADRAFEPAMRQGHWLGDTAGTLFGTGPGRGMGLLLVILGLAQIGLALAGLRWRTLHHVGQYLHHVQRLAGRQHLQAALPASLGVLDLDDLPRAAQPRPPWRCHRRRWSRSAYLSSPPSRPPARRRGWLRLSPAASPGTGGSRSPARRSRGPHRCRRLPRPAAAGWAAARAGQCGRAPVRGWRASQTDAA
jgi:hypothetical protein